MSKKQLINRIIQIIIVLFGISLITFTLIYLAPGDPVRTMYAASGMIPSEDVIQQIRESMGLNDPFFVQYWNWLSSCLRGDFGISYKYKRDVKAVIGDVCLNTIILGGIAYISTFLLALLLGIYCALHEDRILDRIIITIGNITSCIPSFWISLILILIFGVNLAILPTSGAYSIGMSDNIGDRIIHLILPLIVLILGHLWYYAYMVRNKILEEMREDYVLLAKVKGLNKSQIIYRHCLRNIAPSFITIMAVSVPHILAGTYVVEKVFSYPGIGTLIFESAKYHDYNMLMILTLITGILVLVSNMVAQIINTKIDPRMKYERGEIFEP